MTELPVPAGGRGAVSGSDADLEPPEHYDKMVSAAFLRLMKHTQAEAASAVGRAARTIRRWENSEWWPVAEAEARERWGPALADEARATVFHGVRSKRNRQGRLVLGDANLAFRVLERMEKKLRPPKQQVELEGRGAIFVVGPPPREASPPQEDPDDEDDS